MTNSSSGKIMASLLPYLQGGRGNQLKVTPSGNERAQQENSLPFTVLDDSASYSRLIDACFVSDAGTPLKRVLLQVEKDRLGAGSDTLRPVTNADIDSAWQEAFLARKDDPREILLGSQRDGEGRLTRQAPLFYCRERELFFHPVCPSCGLALTLCTDEPFLSARGLNSYCGSTGRYLYCKICCELGGEEIYLYERDYGDPPGLKDRWSLIERFQLVEEIMDPEGHFPCVRCPERAGCFGQGALFRARVTPFSFYPFYLLICEAPSLPAVDFLPLLAGAGFHAVERLLDPGTMQGRLARLSGVRPQGDAAGTLFAAPDRRIFPELLFLKLSFLSEVLKLWLRRRQAPKLERIWVRLAPLSGHLPLLWNFSVEMPGEVVPKPASLNGRRFGSEELAHLGLVWFQTLLQNAAVGAPKVLHAVADDLSLPEEECEAAPPGRLGGITAPENIFWKPGGAVVSPDWLPYWERALALGFQILNAAALKASPLSGEALLESAATLVGELKGMLLAAPLNEATRTEQPVTRTEQPATGSRRKDDQLLCAVVEKLSAAARVEFQISSSLEGGGDTDDGEPDPDEEATVILTPAAARAPIARECDEAITETVVLFSHQAHPLQGPPQAREEEWLAETRIFLPSGGATAANRGGAGAAGSVPPEPEPVQPEAEEADQLGETVVITPGPRPQGSREVKR